MRKAQVPPPRRFTAPTVFHTTLCFHNQIEVPVFSHRTFYFCETICCSLGSILTILKSHELEEGTCPTAISTQVPPVQSLRTVYISSGLATIESPDCCRYDSSLIITLARYYPNALLVSATPFRIRLDFHRIREVLYMGFLAITLEFIQDCAGMLVQFTFQILKNTKLPIRVRCFNFTLRLLPSEYLVL